VRQGCLPHALPRLDGVGDPARCDVCSAVPSIGSQNPLTRLIHATSEALQCAGIGMLPPGRNRARSLGQGTGWAPMLGICPCIRPIRPTYVASRVCPFDWSCSPSFHFIHVRVTSFTCILPASRTHSSVVALRIFPSRNWMWVATPSVPSSLHFLSIHPLQGSLVSSS
jgi:hypothetical protein